MNLTPEQKTKLFQAGLIFVVSVAAVFGIDVSGLIHIGITP